MERETKLDTIEIGRGYAGAILLAVLMATGVVSGIYAGECDNIDISELNISQDIMYMVVGNSSDMEGMNMTINESNIEVCFAVNYKPDNFTLIFFNNITNEVIKEIPTYIRSSGGSSIRYVDRNITQNETVYVPEYVDKIIYTENDDCVDDICEDTTTVLETGYELWHVLLAMALGGAFAWYVVRNSSKEEIEEYESIEEYLEDIDDDTTEE